MLSLDRHSIILSPVTPQVALRALARGPNELYFIYQFYSMNSLSIVSARHTFRALQILLGQESRRRLWPLRLHHQGLAHLSRSCPLMPHLH